MKTQVLVFGLMVSAGAVLGAPSAQVDVDGFDDRGLHIDVTGLPNDGIVDSVWIGKRQKGGGVRGLIVKKFDVPKARKAAVLTDWAGRLAKTEPERLVLLVYLRGRVEKGTQGPVVEVRGPVTLTPAARARIVASLDDKEGALAARAKDAARRQEAVKKNDNWGGLAPIRVGNEMRLTIGPVVTQDPKLQWTKIVLSRNRDKLNRCAGHWRGAPGKAKFTWTVNRLGLAETIDDGLTARTFDKVSDGMHSEGFVQCVSGTLQRISFSIPSTPGAKVEAELWLDAVQHKQPRPSSKGSKPSNKVTIAWHDVRAKDVDTKGVARVLRARSRAFATCLTQGSAVELSVRWRIDARGRVVKPTASGGPKGTTKCVESVLKRLRFPRPTSPTDVIVTLRASP